jgi:hypothetical protein
MFMTRGFGVLVVLGLLDELVGFDVFWGFFVGLEIVV